MSQRATDDRKGHTAGISRADRWPLSGRKRPATAVPTVVRVGGELPLVMRLAMTKNGVSRFAGGVEVDRQAI